MVSVSVQSSNTSIHSRLLTSCMCPLTLGDQPGLKREIGHKPIRGLCQRLKGKFSAQFMVCHWLICLK
jgi:hypothetical protein